MIASQNLKKILSTQNVEQRTLRFKKLQHNNNNVNDDSHTAIISFEDTHSLLYHLDSNNDIVYILQCCLRVSQSSKSNE